jgi:hypothetical protein
MGRVSPTAPFTLVEGGIMKGLAGKWIWLGCFMLIAIAAQKAPVKTEGVHHLLMLDQREAVEHSKTLHHYVLNHKTSMERPIVAKHVDEIGRNMQGMWDELSKLQETTEKTAPEYAQLATIREHQLRARAAFDQLKLEADKTPLDPDKLALSSADLYKALQGASTEHKKAMSKAGIPEPTEPANK